MIPFNNFPFLLLPLFPSLFQDTIGNLYYALTNFLLLSPHLFPPSLTLITSSFHMPRTKLLGAWIFGLSDLPKKGIDEPFRLTFEETANVGLTLAAVKEREAKEALAVENLLTVIPRVATTVDLFEWLTGNHALYSAEGLVKRSQCDKSFDETVPKAALESYGAVAKAPFAKAPSDLCPPNLCPPNLCPPCPPCGPFSGPFSGPFLGLALLLAGYSIGKLAERALRRRGWCGGGKAEALQV